MAEAELGRQLVALLEGGQAHATFEDAVEDFPVELRGVVPEGLPYSAWQILEHMRIAQRDILDFSAPPTGGYHGLKWPEAVLAEVGGAGGRRRLGSESVAAVRRTGRSSRLC